MVEGVAMNENKARRQIIGDLLKQYPTAPKQTLARLLRKRYPQEFESVEIARTSIRYYTASQGKTKGRVIMDEAMLQHAHDAKIRQLYLNGDICDFYQASQWMRDPRQRNMQDEINVLHEILDMLKPRFDVIAYKIGNHEYRLTRKLFSSVPELAVLNQFSVDKVLDLKSRNIDIIKDKQRAKFGGLSVWHGHELQKGLTVPVNIARGVWLRTNERGLCSHYHRTSTHVEVAGVGEHTYTCYSIGCMCDLSPDYAPVNKWNHGFAVIDVTGKSYQVSNYVIDRGKVHAAG
jgi:hypothetical protein